MNREKGKTEVSDKDLLYLLNESLSNLHDFSFQLTAIFISILCSFSFFFRCIGLQCTRMFYVFLIAKRNSIVCPAYCKRLFEMLSKFYK